ncbi:MAG: biotin transporter BioY [Rhodobacteraceae bacterium]|nr:biotin transporter BioY [Paracoccaceae bacterium]
MTLTRALVPAPTLAQKAALVLAGTALIAISAQISVPFFPVPMTLQTLAVLLVGFALGARLGALTVAAYVAEGAMGLPVFSGFKAGLGGPTTGFLLGFVAMAFIAGWAADRGVRSVPGLALVALAASAVLYLPGVAWLGAAIGFEKAIAVGMMPFLLGDVVKAVLAALIVTGGWSLLGRKRG